MKSLVKSVPASIVGYVMLVVILTAGAAQSLSGSNTVYGDDIVDGTITTPDLKAGSIAGSRLLNNGITGAKLYDGTVRSADVGDNSLTGADVNEATLNPTCPSAMTRVADICYTSARAAQGFNGALADCADESLTLPTYSELELVVNDAVEPNYLWTDTIYWNGVSDYSAMSLSDGGGSYSDISTVHSYRCVTTVGARP